DFHVTGVQTCALPISTGVKPGRFLSYQNPSLSATKNLPGLTPVGWAPPSATAASYRLRFRADNNIPSLSSHLNSTLGSSPPLRRSEERRVGKDSLMRW